LCEHRERRRRRRPQGSKGKENEGRRREGWRVRRDGWRKKEEREEGEGACRVERSVRKPRWQQCSNSTLLLLCHAWQVYRPDVVGGSEACIADVYSAVQYITAVWACYKSGDRVEGRWEREKGKSMGRKGGRKEV